MKKWFDKTLTVTRDVWLTDDDGNKITTEEQEVGTIDCHIQQISEEKAAAMEMEYRSTFYLYTDVDADIETGDQVGNYTVKDVKTLSTGRIRNNHKRAVVQQ